MSGACYCLPGVQCNHARGDRFDQRTHSCGCVTYFDLAAWRSVLAVACEQHERPWDRQIYPREPARAVPVSGRCDCRRPGLAHEPGAVDCIEAPRPESGGQQQAAAEDVIDRWIEDAKRRLNALRDNIAPEPVRIADRDHRSLAQLGAILITEWEAFNGGDDVAVVTPEGALTWDEVDLSEWLGLILAGSVAAALAEAARPGQELRERVREIVQDMARAIDSGCYGGSEYEDAAARLRAALEDPR